MKRLSCPYIRDNLSAYLDGELGPEDNLLIKNHLQECSSCQAYLSGLKNLQQTLNSVVQSTTSSLEPPIGLTEEITRRLPRHDFGVLADPVMRRVVTGVAVFLVLIVGGLKLNQTLQVPQPSPCLALVTQIQGDAEKYIKDNQWQALKLSGALEPQDLIKTKADSNLKLQLQDGSALFVKEGSLLEIKNLVPEVKFSLSQGEILVFVPKSSLGHKFVIQTPVVEIQVLGTVFKVCVDKKKTEVEVLKGEVELKGSSKEGVIIVLKQFEKAVVSQQIQQPFSPKKMSSEEIETLKEEFRQANLLEEKRPINQKRSIIFWREIK